ncbi:UNVERIFIED_CONTAM: hypothetical protein Slati_1948400 [Sesamum latifolium]|uniref:Uncharacterized protein n=1 Tax=Sesamum latifolium TaxID=2727402 RepID=A0AAW2X3R5_9LAMI
MSHPQSRNPSMHPSMARGILAPTWHYGAPHAPATPVSCLLLTRCILRARLHRGRLLCLARVGPHLKFEAHSICRHLAVIPHIMPDMPSCLSAWLHNLLAVRRCPMIAHLSQRTPMDG